MFTVRKGTKCKVYRKGTGGGWIDHRMAKTMTFATHGVADNGGMWVFAGPDGWLMKVASSFVEGREPKSGWKPGDYQRGTFNRCILGRNGRGSSRRKSRGRR